MRSHDINNHEDNLFIERFSLPELRHRRSPGILVDLTAALIPLK